MPQSKFPAAAGAAPYLPAERLDVYQAAVEFHELASSVRPAPGGLRDQLLRASVSVVMNLAEGAGRRSRLDKARFYSIALGSTTECGAAWELLRRQQAVDAATYHSGRSLIVRVAQMLSRLERSMRA